MTLIVLSALPMLATLTWLAALMVDPGDFAGTSVLLLGIGWLLMTTVGTIGLVLVGGRWAQLALLFVLATTLFVSVFRPTDVLSVSATAMTVAALVGLFSPQLGRQIRKLPSAAGPPPNAVMATLVPLSFPLVVGLTPSPSNVWVLAWALLGPVAALAYSRTLLGGLVALRYVLPVVTIAAGFPMGAPHGLIAAVTAGIGAAFAWTRDASIAFHPLIEKGSTYAIPPELAPREILEGARIDEKGNPL